MTIESDAERFSFDLVAEPWIPCVDLGGRGLELGLRDTLLQAHELAVVADSSPLATAALHRLLLAIVHRVHDGPADETAWEALWEAGRGRFDAAPIGGYLDHWREKGRFDLFHPVRPFYQAAGLGTEYARPIAKLAHEQASAETLFDHRKDAGRHPFTSAQAARALVAHQAFALGGFVSFEKGLDPKVFKSADGAPLVKAAVALVRGGTLFRTLLLNLHKYNRAEDVPFHFRQGATDRPAWEDDDQPFVGDRAPDGYLDLLTWQSRRIRLLPERAADGRTVVPAVVVMKGSQFPDDVILRGIETMVAFGNNPRARPGEDPFPLLGFREERALWRDSEALLRRFGDHRPHPPRTLEWLATLVDDGVLERGQTLNLDLLGLASDQGRIDFWRHERLPLPLAYLDDQALVEQLHRGLQRAEAVGRLLRASSVPHPTTGRDVSSPIRVLAEGLAAGGGRRPDPALIRQIATALAPGRRYWPRLEAPFADFLTGLADPTDTVTVDGDPVPGVRALAKWTAEVGGAARAAFDETVRDLVGSNRCHEAVAQSELRFRYHLRSLVGSAGAEPEQTDETIGEEVVIAVEAREDAAPDEGMEAMRR